MQQYTCFRDTAQHSYPIYVCLYLYVFMENILTYLYISWVELGMHPIADSEEWQLVMTKCVLT